ncbi:hypothetical protein AB0C21_05560 [Spirillospora sp. NPDC049024]
MTQGPRADHPEPDRGWRMLGRLGCLTGLVAVAAVPFLLWFGLPWWLDKPQRDAEGRVKDQVTTALDAAARRGGIDQHAALHAAAAAHSQMVHFTTTGTHVEIVVLQIGYGGMFGKGVDDFCYRFTVDRAPTRRPRIETARLDRCPRPPSTRPRAIEQIRETAEATRAELHTAAAAGRLTEQRVRPMVSGDLSSLWSFQRNGTETIIVADYISLTPAGEVEAAECAQFNIVQGQKTQTATMYRLPQCPSQ